MALAATSDALPGLSFPLHREQATRIFRSARCANLPATQCASCSCSVQGHGDTEIPCRVQCLHGMQMHSLLLHELSMRSLFIPGSPLPAVLSLELQAFYSRTSRLLGARPWLTCSVLDKRRGPLSGASRRSPDPFSLSANASHSVYHLDPFQTPLSLDCRLSEDSHYAECVLYMANSFERAAA